MSREDFWEDPERYGPWPDYKDKRIEELEAKLAVAERMLEKIPRWLLEFHRMEMKDEEEREKRDGD